MWEPGKVDEPKRGEFAARWNSNEALISSAIWFICMRQVCSYLDTWQFDNAEPGSYCDHWRNTFQGRCCCHAVFSTAKTSSLLRILI